MAKLEWMTGSLFKKDESGNTLFYPWGVLGSGLIVDSDEREEQIRAFIKKSYIIGFIVILGAQILFGSMHSFFVLILWCSWYYFSVKKFRNELPRTTVKLTVSEGFRKGAEVYNLPFLVIGAILSIGVVVSGFYILSSGGDDIIGFSAVGFFALCTIAYFYMIYCKLNNTS